MSNQQKIFNGAFLTVAMRWSDRLIGLVSMIVLARILVPADFGIVAMASLVVGLVDVVLDLGVNQVLIHNKEAKKSDFDTAWTVRLALAIVAGLLIAGCSPLAADYFNEPLVVNVLFVMALSMVVGGFENIGIICFQKELNFTKDFQFFFFRRFAGFVLTMVLAIIYESYWAMVFGTLFSRFFGVALSYVMHPMRPVLDISRFSAIWSFSKWVMFKNVGAYFDLSMDKLLVGRYLSSSSLGGYTIASEVSALPTTELLAPLGRVLFPAFVDKRDEPEAFVERVLMAISVQCLIAIPACIGLIFVATDLVGLVFGEKWLFIVPLIKILAFTNLIGTFAHSCSYALLALGQVKVQALVVWIQAILFAIGATWLLSEPAADEFALTRTVAVMVGSCILIGLVMRQLQALTILRIAANVIRPLVASVAMYMTLDFAAAYMADMLPLLRLLVSILLGALIYVGAVLLLWLLAKTPEGAEAYIVRNIRVKLAAPG